MKDVEPPWKKGDWITRHAYMDSENEPLVQDDDENHQVRMNIIFRSPAIQLRPVIWSSSHEAEPGGEWLSFTKQFSHSISLCTNHEECRNSKDLALSCAQHQYYSNSDNYEFVDSSRLLIGPPSYYHRATIGDFEIAATQLQRKIASLIRMKSEIDKEILKSRLPIIVGSGAQRGFE